MWLRSWIPSTVRLAALCVFNVIGGMYFRNVKPFMIWPWSLAQLVHPAISAEDRTRHLKNLYTSESCCGGRFTNKMRLRMQHELDLSAETRQLLLDVFQGCPATHIRSEFRFARCRRHHESAHGHMPSPATIASDHVLAEFEDMYEEAVTRPFKCC